jgi:hypothetical protein
LIDGGKEIFKNALSKAGLAKCIHTIAKINNTDTINIGDFSKQRSALQQLWSKTSYEIVKLSKLSWVCSPRVSCTIASNSSLAHSGLSLSLTIS